MAFLRRRPSMPSAIRARLALPTDDRVLAEAAQADGWAVATTRMLLIAPSDGEVVRRPWSDVDGARLDAETMALTVTWVDGSLPTVLHLAENGATAFARTVHERVQSSVVHSEKVELGRRRVVRVVLRRGPDGGLLTQVIGSGSIDLGDPATAARIDAAEARVREAAGLD